MAIQESILYKISRAGVFLGLLNDVKPDLNYNALINNPGSQVVLELTRSPDTSSPDYGDSSLLQEGNDIEIIKFNDTYPNGKTKFKGYISDWTANFGGSETVQVTCLPYGTLFNQMVIESGDTAYITNNNDNGASWAVGTGGDKNPMKMVLQVFTLAANKVIGAVTLELSTAVGDAASVYVQIRQQAGASPNLNTDATIMTGFSAVAGGVTKGQTRVTFPGASQLNTGNTYYMTVTWTGVSDLTVWGSSANPYANGTVWTTAFTSGTSWDAPTQVAGSDLWFTIWQHGGSTNAAYTSQDPTAILSDIISFYNQAGGIIQPPTNPITPLLSQPISSGNVPGATWGAGFAQTFTPTSPMTINIIQLLLSVTSGSSFVQVHVCRGNPTLDTVDVTGGFESYIFGGTNVLLGSATGRLITNTSSNITGFSLGTPLSLSSGVQYYILVEFGQSDFGNLVFKGGTSSDSPIAPFGSMYYALVTFNNSSTGMSFHSSTPVFYCNIGYQLPVPASIDGGFPSTGVSATYTFKVNTVLEGIQKMLEYSPFGWYWYVDMGTNTLYFQAAGSAADHTLVKGRHINELNLKRTSEYIKNVVYFTGGDDGSGSNVFVKKTNATSLASYPIGLDRPADNLVTNSTQAGILAQDDLDRNASPVYQTTVKIPAGVDDLDSYQVGQMVDFANFNNFIDDILLQIVGLRYTPDMVTLTLGSVAPRSSQTVTDLKRDLISLQTLNNPSSPS
jgi:hypothetical protein